MQIAMIGLGRMGGNMAQRLLQGGHDVVVYDRSEEARKNLEGHGARSVASLDELPGALTTPRAVWVMVPAGDPTQSTIDTLEKLLDAGDVIIDGGNSNFRQSIARSDQLKAKNIEFIDAGVSGGVWGLAEGYCLMVGGSEKAVAHVRPAFDTLAPTDGFGHVGGPGAGHFTKMVHNGIEYGAMQAYAEGFELMHSASEWNLDLGQIAELWRHGSVVRSWLLDLLSNALNDPDTFAQVKGYVEDSGEGRWTVEEGINRAVPLPVITASLFARFASRQDESFAARVNAALRNQFGGHAVKLESGESSGPMNKPLGSQ
jgi:6-phosphogluconate dehydrogenase